ncbi:MAG TPA: class I SAM-dependent methyltransferase [Chloroflexota bacterium]|nr:class I SAM-dependent methyltransferase [Chloroflexota bacterium]
MRRRAAPEPLPPNVAGVLTVPTARVEHCPMCGHGPGVVRHVGARDRWFGTPGSWTFRYCPLCSGLWLDPRPASASLPMLYERYYTHDVVAGHETPSALARVRSHLPWHSLDEAGALGYLTELAPGRVLDVGCGNGARMRRFHLAGWSAAGVDMDPGAVQRARLANVGDVVLGTLHDVEVSTPFDAVVMFHVLEHLEDPLAALRRARELLRPGGTLAVATPNAASWLHERYGHRWRGLEPPRHLQIFSLPALERVAQDAGFVQVQVFTTARNAGNLALASERSYGKPMSKQRSLALLAKSELLHAAQWFYLRWKPTCGEELVAIATA